MDWTGKTENSNSLPMGTEGLCTKRVLARGTYRVQIRPYLYSWLDRKFLQHRARNSSEGDLAVFRVVEDGRKQLLTRRESRKLQ